MEKKNTAIFKRQNNVGVWRICAKNVLSFPAYRLQKSHFKIFDVPLRYSGSHFGAAAYLKMTGLKDPVFLLSPLNFPRGIPAQLTFFFFITTTAFCNSWQQTGCALQWFPLMASPKLTCGTAAWSISLKLPWGEQWWAEFEEMRPHLSSLGGQLATAEVCSVPFTSTNLRDSQASWT